MQIVKKYVRIILVNLQQNKCTTLQTLVRKSRKNLNNNKLIKTFYLY